MSLLALSYRHWQIRVLIIQFLTLLRRVLEKKYSIRVIKYIEEFPLQKIFRPCFSINFQDDADLIPSFEFVIMTASKDITEKNPFSSFVRKPNFRIITIFGRAFLNYESGRKTLSKLQRPETGRASSWELNCMQKNRKIQFPCLSLESLVQDTKFQSQY